MPPVATPAPPLFRPSAAAADALIPQLADPALSLQDLAARHDTTVEALAAWMTSPDIRARLETVDSATTWRTRLAANSQLTAVTHALSLILQSFNDANDRSKRSPRPGEPAPSTPAPESPSFLLRLREQEMVRKSAQLLVRLASARPVAGPDQLAPAASRTRSAATTPAPTAAASQAAAPAHSAPATELGLDAIAALFDRLNIPDLPASPATQTEGESTRATQSPAPRPQSAPTNHAEPAPSPATPINPILPIASPRPFVPVRKSQSRPNHAKQLLAAATREHWP